MKDIKELKKYLKKRKTDETAHIKKELNRLEQYGRMNNLEVHELAETPNENLLDKLNTIADKSQAPRLTKENVEAVHRVPNEAKKKCPWLSCGLLTEMSEICGFRTSRS